jgi:hypothetical protein
MQEAVIAFSPAVFIFNYNSIEDVWECDNNYFLKYFYLENTLK